MVHKYKIFTLHKEVINFFLPNSKSVIYNNFFAVFFSLINNNAPDCNLKSQDFALNLRKTHSKISKTANAAEKKSIKKEIKKTNVQINK